MKTELFNGDCVELMKNIDSKSIDLILTDPPYGTTQLKFDKEKLQLNLIWNEYKRIIKDNGAIIMFSKQPFTTDLISSNRSWYRYNLIWLKNISNGFLNSKIMPLQVYEEICVFYKHTPIYNPQMEHGFERKISKASSKRKCQQTEIYNKVVCARDYDSTSRYPINVLYFDVVRSERLHPSQKPTDLLEYLIKTYSDVGMTVLDSFMGSGSTGIACINTGRNFIGIEKDNEYFKIASDRISEQKRRRENENRII